MAGCRLSVVVAAALTVLPYVTVGLQFYLQGGETRCFSDSVAPNTKVLGEYTVAAGQGHMPVDIVVTDIVNNNNTLFSRANIDHGKFAFITPFGKQAPRIHTAELHRKEHHDHDNVHEHVPEHDHQHDHESDHNHGRDHNHDHPENPDWDKHYSHGSEDHVQHRRTRSLLNAESDHYSHDRNYEHRGSGDHGGYDHDHNHDNPDHHRYDQHYEHDRERNHNDAEYLKHVERDKSHHDDLEKLDHMDAHDGRHEDMKDEWDMDKYDGLEDEELEKEWLENERRKEQESVRVPVLEEDEDLFNTRTFEICVSSPSAPSTLHRRVRLVLRHGKAAHDYTRLAKKEHLSSLELTLQVVSDELKELHSELDHARQMEDVLRVVNEATNRRVVTYASVSLLIMIAVGAAQAVYTKKFFKHKKLL